MFTGQERDFETALDYLRARQLRADHGRFTAPDPLTDLAWTDATLGAANAYGYAASNPLRFVDPSGAGWIDVLVHLAWIARDASDWWQATHPTVNVVGTMPPPTVFHTGGIRETPRIGGSGGPGEPGGGQQAQPRDSQQPGRPECQLARPGGNYSLGPNAVALFQPQMATALTDAFTTLNGEGITPMITSGYRTAADQLRMQNGASGPNPAARVSWHQVGMAVDINPLGSNFARITTVMQGQGLNWGGTLPPPNRDLPHFVVSPFGTSPTAAVVAACAAAAGGQR